MRKFDYSFLRHSLLPVNLINITSNIAELKSLESVRKKEINYILPDVSAKPNHWLCYLFINQKLITLFIY
ncbi:MAG: hypothetical protein LBI80_06010 [Endomicrobium sp.]|jgi:hypothetical protein|nr:hypothetical protein [Endomicrobium sp.]